MFGATITGLVAAGKLRSDYADLRVVRNGGVLPRVIEPVNATTISVCFKLPTGLSASQPAGYEIQYGEPSAAPPAVDPSTVFAFYDGFSGGALGSAWLVHGAPVVTGGNLRLPMGAESGVTTTAATDGIAHDAVLEMRATISQPASAPISGSSFYYWFGFQHAGDFVASEPWSIFVGRAANNIQVEHNTNNGSACDPGCTGLIGTQQSASRFYSIMRFGTDVRFAIDNGAPFNATGDNGDMSIMIRNYLQNSDVLVDWVRARALVTPEPTATLGAEQNLP
jgi:hypothetical protein